GAHAGETATRTATECHESRRRPGGRRRRGRLDGAIVHCRHQTPTVPTPTVARNQLTNSVQPPVTSASPTSTSRAPPIRVTQALCRGTHANSPSSRRNQKQKTRNGSPNRRQKAKVRVIARAVCPTTETSPSTAPGVG